MNATARTPTPTAAQPAVKSYAVADPELIAALAAIEDAGAPLDPAALAEQLGRVPSNLRRSLSRLEVAGIVSLDPLEVPDRYRRVAAAWQGEDAARTGTPGTLPLSALHRCPLNPRRTFEDDALRTLAEDIAERGILQNLRVRPRAGSGTDFEVVIGERRWRALQLLLEDRRAGPDYPVPVAIHADSDDDVVLIALSENMQRKDMPPLEEAEAFAAYHDRHVERRIGAGQTERAARAEATAALAKAAGLNERVIQRRIKVVREAIAPVLAALRDGSITMRAAETLAGGTAEDQSSLFDLHKRGEDGYRTSEDLAERLKEIRSQREFERAQADAERIVNDPAPPADTPIMDASTGTPARSAAPAPDGIASRVDSGIPIFDLCRMWEEIFISGHRMQRATIDARLRQAGVEDRDTRAAAMREAVERKVIALAEKGKTPDADSFALLWADGALWVDEPSAVKARERAEQESTAPAPRPASPAPAPAEPPQTQAEPDWKSAAADMADAMLLAEIRDLVGRGDLKITANVLLPAKTAQPKRAHAAIAELLGRIERAAGADFGPARVKRGGAMYQLARG